MNKRNDNPFFIVYIGFMRLVTLNFKLWCKPTELGWRRR